MESPNPAAHAVTQALTVQLPAPSTAGASPAPPLMVIGFADALFIAFFVAAICRFVTRSDTFARTVYALVGLLGLYAVIVLMTGLSLPALVPMAVVMIALHWRQFHYERSELFALLYAGLFILVIIAVFWYFGPILSHSSPGRG